MFTNPCLLTATPDEVLTLDHLTRIEFVEIVHDKQDGIGKKEKMIYFLDNGTTRVLSVENLLIKTIKELKYVHYLLKVTDKVTEIWSIIILSNIKKRIMDGDDSYTRECIPAYTDLFGKEIPMKKKSAKIKESHSRRQSRRFNVWIYKSHRRQDEYESCEEYKSNSISN